MLLSDRAAALPGLAEACTAATAMSDMDVRRGCLLHETLIRSAGPNLNFVTRLPVTSAATIKMTASPTAASLSPIRNDPATHLLHGYQAYPLSQRTLYLSARGSVAGTRQPNSSCSITGTNVDIQISPLSDISIYVDGERLTRPRRIHAGGKISFAGSDTVYSLISAVSPDGP